MHRSQDISWYMGDTTLRLWSLLSAQAQGPQLIVQIIDNFKYIWDHLIGPTTPLQTNTRLVLWPREYLSGFSLRNPEQLMGRIGGREGGVSNESIDSDLKWVITRWVYIATIQNEFTSPDDHFRSCSRAQPNRVPYFLCMWCWNDIK